MTGTAFKTQPDTDAALDSFLKRFADQSEDQALFQIDYTLEAQWLPATPVLQLQGIYLLTKHGGLLTKHGEDASGASDPVQIQAIVCDAGHRIQQDANPGQAFQAFARKHGLPIIDFCNPWLLAPATIEKPWGQEIWFSGMEERGTTRVTDGGGYSPMPWVLSLAPNRLCGRKTPTLMKILAPVADDPLGNLYFEIHHTKQETYIVTGIETAPHPHTTCDNPNLPATGYIRLGMNAQHRRRFKNDREFLSAYQSAVAEYRVVRTQIDAQLNEEKLRNGYAPNEVIHPQLQRQWLSRLDPQLRHEEARARELMNQFTQLFPLYVGDLVQVPSGLPHALQHGVNVLEFQTPVYERSIISFEQHTLTQAHWDTESALTRLSLTHAEGNIRSDKDLESNTVVARFDKISLYRIQLEPDATFHIQPADHGVGYILAGECQLQSETPLARGSGFLISRSLLTSGCRLTARGSRSCLCYLALENMQP